MWTQFVVVLFGVPEYLNNLRTSRPVFASQELAERKTFSNNIMKWRNIMFRFWHLFLVPQLSSCDWC